jgi:hypothetical protein
MSLWRKNISVALLAAVLSGCATNVAVNNPRIPDPLITQMPLSVGARYPEVFDHFVHEEQVIGKEKWQVNLGASNKLLFDKLFSAMFTEFQVIDESVDPASMGIDVMIEPTIDAFEFSVPEQSQTDAFAVWIRYRIKIFDRNGTQIANWPISAYGKSQTTMFGDDEALRRAAVLAMRDAAALIIMQMDKSTGISSLINSAGAGPAAAGATIQTTATEEIADEPQQVN